MNPYDVLDVSPRATMKEISIRYRELLLLHHPDLHAQEGPDAVREAERCTRELNEAMALLRTQHPAEGVHFGSGSSFADSADAVSFAWDTPTSSHPMTCPLCGTEFAGGVAAVELHVKDVHGVDVRRQPKARRQRRFVLKDSDRKMIRTGLLVTLIVVLLVLIQTTGSIDRIKRGEFDPFIPLLGLIWLMILGRVFLFRRY